ncbi:DUF6789 family protein [Riemerella columbipharyngis]|uniref:Uncharacterized protein n=1 Tax=Riemerella columbipharyngis TaxID=1071918 RepID=A0A1G7EMJ4_9FLAO|nr:DUF6789 family protein [Riemerella columbipharyngis]SDE64847.1 hypothetical protein SAMN05421544_11652 [Riemerella columbipharyngis]
MNSRIQRIILSGIIGTAAMTVFATIAPMMGMPEMSPAKKISAMLKLPLFIGWVMHFMMGIIFTFLYVILWADHCKIKYKWLKGGIFGVMIFLIAQILMLITQPMNNFDIMTVATMMGSLVGHIVFGIVVAMIMGNSCRTNKYCN